jgi:hypothetical protein
MFYAVVDQRPAKRSRWSVGGSGDLLSVGGKAKKPRIELEPGESERLVVSTAAGLLTYNHLGCLQ